MTFDLPTPLLVTKTDILQQVAKTLSQEPIVAVDTESNSLHAYQEQVCLIQFSSPQQDYLIDPLSLDDLSPLAPLFASKDTEKVFHAAEYDLIVLERDFDFEFSNLFDTMLAARILGWQKVGLANVLESQFGIKPNKRYQRANWGRRPIPDEMLQYAQVDTHYLIQVRERLHKELVEAGRWQLAEEDFQRSCNVTQPNNGNPREGCWLTNGVRELNNQQRAVLKELCLYRDKIARSANLPLFKVLHTKTLVELALYSPTTIQDIRELNLLSDRLFDRHAHRLVKAIRRGLKSDPVHIPRHKRPSEAYLARVDWLKNWRKKTGIQVGVGSDVILPRDLLETIAQHNPRTMQQLGEILNDVPWRMEHYGEEILHILTNHF